MRLALAQMEIRQGDPHANLRKMEGLIRRAKSRGADVIVLPEYALTGSVKGREQLIAEDGAYRQIFSALAKKHGIDIVCGSFVERNHAKPYNTSCYFDRSGKMLGIYRKRNLWHSERGRIARGKEPAVFDTRFGKCGIAICWDLANPLLFRRMAKEGAKVIFVPSFWSDAGISNFAVESRNIDALCFARAFENECAIVYVNAAGQYEPGDNLIGHSQLTLPIRGAVKKAAHGREALIVADLPEKSLLRAAKVYKIRQDILSGYQL